MVSLALSKFFHRTHSVLKNRRAPFHPGGFSLGGGFLSAFVMIMHSVQRTGENKVAGCRPAEERGDKKDISLLD
jgi:hypothetical protein